MASSFDEASRASGRGLEQLRPFFLRTGVISQAAGSAYIESDNVKVMTGVYGPRQAQTGEFSATCEVRCTVKVASFASADRPQRVSSHSTHEEKQLQLLLASALEKTIMLSKYPKSVIDVNVMVMESDGDVLTSAITCGSLALASAGI